MENFKALLFICIFFSTVHCPPKKPSITFTATYDPHEQLIEKWATAFFTSAPASCRLTRIDAEVFLGAWLDERLDQSRAARKTLDLNTLFTAALECLQMFASLMEHRATSYPGLSPAQTADTLMVVTLSLRDLVNWMANFLYQHITSSGGARIVHSRDTWSSAVTPASTTEVTRVVVEWIETVQLRLSPATIALVKRYLQGNLYSNLRAIAVYLSSSPSSHMSDEYAVYFACVFAAKVLWLMIVGELSAGKDLRLRINNSWAQFGCHGELMEISSTLPTATVAENTPRSLAGLAATHSSGQTF
jgi:hypothetical protein